MPRGAKWSTWYEYYYYPHNAYRVSLDIICCCCGHDEGISGLFSIFSRLTISWWKKIIKHLISSQNALCSIISNDTLGRGERPIFSHDNYINDVVASGKSIPENRLNATTCYSNTGYRNLLATCRPSKKT